MKFADYRNHRNSKYLTWLRRQPCVVSGQKAECAHHVRQGTNGGIALRPSDYFCIPLLNEFHTTGSFALHIVGEDTFFKHFKLIPTKLFINYLSKYLIENFNIHIQLPNITDEALLEVIIKMLEENTPFSPAIKKRGTRANKEAPKKSRPNSEYYQKSKELKKAKDRVLREQLKKEKVVTISKPFMDSDFYKKAKEARRKKDRELREKHKERVSQYRKEQYQKMKALKKNLG